MKTILMKQELTTVLNYLENGYGIHLNDDVFLCGYLDGSDKIYGFINSDNELFVITRQCSNGYPISQMEKKDLKYMFNLSNIFNKIKNKEYEIVLNDFI